MIIQLLIVSFVLVAYIAIIIFIIKVIYEYLKKIVHKENTHNEGTFRPSVLPSVEKAHRNHDNKIALQAEAAENTVEDALRRLQVNRYFVFRDLIIPSSSKSISLTQIDHVVVSRKGIFCIETKSSKGNIYGFSRNENWKQYLGNSGKPYPLNSPFRQNRHHVSSLEVMLKGRLKAPIHSYIAFPNAYKVVVDSKVEDMSPGGITNKIERHSRDIYDYAEVESIAKILAHAGSLRDELRNRHIDEVREFLEAKVSGTLKL